MHKPMIKLITVLISVLLAACVTSVDQSLPYDRLPEITVATEVTLVASPSHPTAYLAMEPIAVDEKVQVIGTDKDAAWLLVLYKDRLGWMPTFYSRTNIGVLKPAIVVDPAPDKCTKYLGATFVLDEPWTSKTSGDVFVVGSIYRSPTETPFEKALLTLEITGGGTVIDADYMHTPLTSSKAVVLFGFSVAGLQKDSQLQFNLTNPAEEVLVFQAAYFSNDCPETLNQLPIGEVKVQIADEAGLSTKDGIAQNQQTPTAITTPIQKESGPSKPKSTATPNATVLPESPDPNWETIFYDSFDDGDANGWIRNKFQYWRVRNGEYHVTISTKDTRATTLTGLSLSTDYAIEFRVKNVSCVDDGLEIIGLYTLSLRHGSEYGAPNVVLWNRDGKVVEDKPYPLERNRWYKVRTEVTDHNILVYIDGNLLMAHFDDRSPESSDAIGLWGWSGACIPFEAYYDDVMVYVKRQNPTK